MRRPVAKLNATGHSFPMLITHSSTGGLTSLTKAVHGLFDGLSPVAPMNVPLAEATGLVAAEMAPLATPVPAFNTAAIDGYAFHANALAGASSYSPIPLTDAPLWVETGERMPDGCDCVIETTQVEFTGPIVQVLADAIPGQGMRRAGEDIPAERSIFTRGQHLTSLDLLVAHAAGLDHIAVRRPLVRLIDVTAPNNCQTTTHFISARLQSAGAHVIAIEHIARDGDILATALDGEPCDLIVLIGGTGGGRLDMAAAGLGARGTLVAHGIALQPGRTTAIARIGGTPAIALPGTPGQALGAYLAIVQPVIDHLSGRLARNNTVLPLARKISSAIGIAEVVLLQQRGETWAPLAIGSISLEHIALADAWFTISDNSEGYPTGTPVGALPLRDIG